MNDIWNMDEHSDNQRVEPPSPSMDASPEATPGPSMAEIDLEVAQAMASMDSTDLADLANLHGNITTNDAMPSGTECTGTIASVSDDDVFLEFSAKSQGVMPRSQFGKNEAVEVGRRVDVVVERFDDAVGLLIVNRKGAVQRATWTNLTKGMLVNGRVVGVVKGGLEVNLNGIRAFMPGSQVDIAPMKDISLLLNETVRCEVLEVNRRQKDVLVSRRKALQHELAEQKETLKKELTAGQVRPGVVSRIMDFGAFVDLGGIDGLLHISDLSWKNVDKVSNVLTPGQKVEVKVLKVDFDRDRISLGLKQLQPDPWNEVAQRYEVGAAVKVRVTRLTKFGAFAELEESIEGLIPLSEMSWSRISGAGAVARVGDVVDAVIIRVEPAKRRLALSLKQAQPDPWANVLESFSPKSLVTGKVTRLADFGAFVELVPGVEGLIHISELSDRRVRTCADMLEVGQEVEARVLGVDLEHRRISLSIKAVNAALADAAGSLPDSQEASKPPKKRKKPLRGGLASHFDW